jgi:RNA-binding motif X-linked protein 2
MNTIKEISRINEEELKLKIPLEASWHAKYSHSAYIIASGLPFEMTEGDVVIVFSQCGEIVDCNLIRDKETGKSKGFVFIAYEDQRSTIIAVDNLNGAEVCGRKIKVDHVDKYRAPKEYLQPEDDKDAEQILYVPSGPEGKGYGDFVRLTEETIFTHNQEISKQTAANILFDEDERVRDIQWDQELMDNIQSQMKKESKDKKEKKQKKHNKHNKHNKHKKHKKHKSHKDKGYTDYYKD